MWEARFWNYDGFMVNNAFEGWGRGIDYEGEIFDGEYSKCSRNGYGKEITKDGKIRIGFWKNDKLIVKE